MTTEQTAKRKADLLAAGLYPTSKGFVLRLSEMNDSHLVNAYVKALAQADPEGVTQPLAAEVDRRGLRGRAIARAEELAGGTP